MIDYPYNVRLLCNSVYNAATFNGITAEEALERARTKNPKDTEDALDYLEERHGEIEALDIFFLAEALLIKEW